MIVCMYVCMYVCTRLTFEMVEQTAKSIIDQIPTDTDELFAFAVNWECLDKVSMCVCVCVCVCMCVCVCVYTHTHTQPLHCVFINVFVVLFLSPV